MTIVSLYPIGVQNARPRHSRQAPVLVMGMNPTHDSDRSRKLAARPVRTGKPNALTGAPANLSAGARRHWDTYVPALDARGVFEASDASWLAFMCESMAEVEQLRAALLNIPVGGLEYARVSVALDRAEKRALAVARENAITPVGRLRAGVVKAGGATLLGILDAEDD